MSNSNCCVDCCQWFAELLLRDGLRDEDVYHPPDEIGIGGGGGDNAEDEKEKTGGVNGIELPAIEAEKLTRPDEPFRAERMRQLFNRHGFNLAVFPGGHVRGVREAFNPYSVLEVLAVSVGAVQVRAVETGLLVAMGPEGRLYGSRQPRNPDSVFMEGRAGPYLTYLSRARAHLGWHLAITQDGQPKNGRLTAFPWGQKAVCFVSRRPYPEPIPVRQLQNRHGFRLAILHDGKVKGSKSATLDKWTLLELLPSVPSGAFRLRGVEADLYLAMNEKGWLYGERDRNSESTLFAEHPAKGRYLTYLSVRWSHLGWYVGIKRSGKAKRAEKTVYPSSQKAIQFQHLRPFPPPPTDADLARALGEHDRGDANALTLPHMAYIDEEDEEDEEDQRDVQR